MDPNGMINETFKKGYLGSDLKEALLIMLNEIKRKQIIPENMTLGNITTLISRKVQDSI